MTGRASGLRIIEVVAAPVEAEKGAGLPTCDSCCYGGFIPRSGTGRDISGTALSLVVR